MKCTIVIEGAEARIEGQFPFSPILDATSYYQKGYQFTQKYKSGFWDGRIRLFNKVKKTFPAGLVQDVVKVLKDCGVRVQVDDRRKCPPIGPIDKNITLHGVSFDYPYDFQLEAMEKMILGQRGVAAMATNSGKSVLAVLIATCLKVPTLFLVPGKELLYQLQKTFARCLNVSIDEIGIIGDGQFKPGDWATIAIVASVHSKLTKNDKRMWDVLNRTDLLFCDEVHRAGSNTWFEVLKSCDAFFRFGLSGTPMMRSDGADLRLIAAMGPVLVEVKNKELIERGISSEVQIQMLPIRKPDIPKGTPYQDAYAAGIVENVYRNRSLCVLVDRFVSQGLKVLMLVRELRHGWAIDKRLWTYKQKSFLTHQFIHGKESTAARQQALKDFDTGDLMVLIATSILDEGVDVPNIDVLVMCGGGKSSIKTLQRVGRGIRRGSTGKLIVVDTVDFHNKYLLEHSYQRFSDYKAEDCFDIREISLKEE
jgi:superfamily II DNA or RNA helicase